jgi:hypothetical protein
MSKETTLEQIDKYSTQVFCFVLVLIILCFAGCTSVYNTIYISGDLTVDAEASLNDVLK